MVGRSGHTIFFLGRTRVNQRPGTGTHRPGGYLAYSREERNLEGSSTPTQTDHPHQHEPHHRCAKWKAFKRPLTAHLSHTFFPCPPLSPSVTNITHGIPYRCDCGSLDANNLARPSLQTRRKRPRGARRHPASHHHHHPHCSFFTGREAAAALVLVDDWSRYHACSYL